MDYSSFFFFIFFKILFFSATFLTTSSSKSIPPSLNCINGSPPLTHFPLSKTSSSFQLFCKNRTTMIHFPNYGDLIVKSISYSDKKLQLADPNSCVHEVFLNLNLTLTPFKYYYVVKNYTYLNCSTRISNSASSFVEIPCLSGSKHHVYSAESWLDVPVFCREIKSVDVPFSYSPYLSDNSFGLALTWSEEKIQGLSNKQWTLGDKLLKAELCFILAILALLAMKKIYHHPRKENKSNPLEELLC